MNTLQRVLLAASIGIAGCGPGQLRDDSETGTRLTFEAANASFFSKASSQALQNGIVTLCSPPRGTQYPFKFQTDLSGGNWRTDPNHEDLIGADWVKYECRYGVKSSLATATFGDNEGYDHTDELDCQKPDTYLTRAALVINNHALQIRWNRFGGPFCNIQDSPSAILVVFSGGPGNTWKDAEKSAANGGGYVGRDTSRVRDFHSFEKLNVAVVAVKWEQGLRPTHYGINPDNGVHMGWVSRDSSTPSSSKERSARPATLLEWIGSITTQKIGIAGSSNGGRQVLAAVWHDIGITASRLKFLGLSSTLNWISPQFHCGDLPCNAHWVAQANGNIAYSSKLACLDANPGSLCHKNCESMAEFKKVMDYIYKTERAGGLGRCTRKTVGTLLDSASFLSKTTKAGRPDYADYVVYYSGMFGLWGDLVFFNPVGWAGAYTYQYLKARYPGPTYLWRNSIWKGHGIFLDPTSVEFAIFFSDAKHALGL